MEKEWVHDWRDRETGRYFPLTKEAFRFLEMLAEGAYGNIWLCEYKKNGLRVAVKRIDKELASKAKMLKSFRNERKALEVMNHPFIVKFYSHFEDEKYIYFVIEYLPNGSLSQFSISRGGQIPSKIVRYYICEVIHALEYLKKNRIVHRSIRPENILLDANGHIRLTRFGQVKLYRQVSCSFNLGDGQTQTTFNSDAQAMGNKSGEALFVSPEILQDKPVSYCTDLWCLGITLFNLLTNTHPFISGSPFLMLKKIKEREVNWKEGMDDNAKDLIDKLIQLKPMDRLGAGKSGYKRLKAHPYFEGVKWKRIMKKRMDNIPVKWKI